MQTCDSSELCNIAKLDHSLSEILSCNFGGLFRPFFSGGLLATVEGFFGCAGAFVLLSVDLLGAAVSSTNCTFLLVLCPELSVEYCCTRATSFSNNLSVLPFLQVFAIVTKSWDKPLVLVSFFCFFGTTSTHVPSRQEVAGPKSRGSSCWVRSAPHFCSNSVNPSSKMRSVFLRCVLADPPAPPRRLSVIFHSTLAILSLQSHLKTDRLVAHLFHFHPLDLQSILKFSKRQSMSRQCSKTGKLDAQHGKICETAMFSTFCGAWQCAFFPLF